MEGSGGFESSQNASRDRVTEAGIFEFYKTHRAALDTKAASSWRNTVGSRTAESRVRDEDRYRLSIGSTLVSHSPPPDSSRRSFQSFIKDSDSRSLRQSGGTSPVMVQPTRFITPIEYLDIDEPQVSSITRPSSEAISPSTSSKPASWFLNSPTRPEPGEPRDSIDRTRWTRDSVLELGYDQDGRSPRPISQADSQSGVRPEQQSEVRTRIQRRPVRQLSGGQTSRQEVPDESSTQDVMSPSGTSDDASREQHATKQRIVRRVKSSRTMRNNAQAVSMPTEPAESSRPQLKLPAGAQPDLAATLQDLSLLSGPPTSERISSHRTNEAEQLLDYARSESPRSTIYTPNTSRSSSNGSPVADAERSAVSPSDAAITPTSFSSSSGPLPGPDALPSIPIGGSCDVCRRRNMTCDGARPRCSTCVRLGFACQYHDTSKKRPDQAEFPRILQQRLEAVGPHFGATSSLTNQLVFQTPTYSNQHIDEAGPIVLVQGRNVIGVLPSLEGITLTRTPGQPRAHASGTRRPPRPGASGHRGNGSTSNAGIRRNRPMRPHPGDDSNAGPQATQARRPVRPPKNGRDTNKRFACPFAKHDRVRYERVYNSCTERPGLESKRLLEHLHRVHSAKSRGKCIWCSYQWLDPENWHEEFETHDCWVRDDRERELSHPECMTKEQEDQIEKLDAGNLTAAERWGLTYQRLFPSDEPGAGGSPDPHYDYLTMTHQIVQHPNPMPSDTPPLSTPSPGWNSSPEDPIMDRDFPDDPPFPHYGTAPMIHGFDPIMPMPYNPTFGMSSADPHMNGMTPTTSQSFVDQTFSFTPSMMDQSMGSSMGPSMGFAAPMHLPQNIAIDTTSLPLDSLPITSLAPHWVMDHRTRSR